MKIVINAFAHTAGGGITYLKNLLPALSGLDDENEYKVIVRQSLGDLGLNLGENFEVIRIGRYEGSLFLRFFFEQVILPLRLKFWGADLLFSPTDITTLAAPCPVLLAIRNPNPYSSLGIERSLYQKLRYKLLKGLTRASARKAERVIFVSDYSREQVERQLKLDPAKTQTVYHGIEKSFFDLSSDSKKASGEMREVPEKFILCLSSIYRHKNFEVLLRGYAQLASEIKEEYELVIVGGVQDQEYFEKLRKLTRELEIQDFVTFTGRVDYEAVPYFYRRADLFVLPSKLETFGHTLVESMASDTPIVAANAASVPEVLGDAGLLFDPEDPEELAGNMTRVLEDEELRKELVKRGAERVEDFSWEKTAKETLDLLEEVGNE